MKRGKQARKQRAPRASTPIEAEPVTSTTVLDEPPPPIVQAPMHASPPPSFDPIEDVEREQRAAQASAAPDGAALAPDGADAPPMQAAPITAKAVVGLVNVGAVQFAKYKWRKTRRPWDETCSKLAHLTEAQKIELEGAAGPAMPIIARWLQDHELVAVGIFALVCAGAISERMNALNAYAMQLGPMQQKKPGDDTRPSWAKPDTKA